MPELKNKILFTVFALLIFRRGSVVPTPFINGQLLSTSLKEMSGTIFDLLGTMNGTAFSMAAVFALGVQPYINSSIIIELLTVAIPALERMARDGGEEGRKKIASITRYTTVAIALLQGFGYYTILRTNNMLNLGTTNAVWAGLVIVLSFTAGACFLMWLGEQCNEFGVGNGISMILFAGIISRVPNMISGMISGVRTQAGINSGSITLDSLTNAGYTSAQAQAHLDGAIPVWGVVLLLVGILALIVFIVFINDAERRIPVQYAKRQVGRKMYGGQSSNLPMKVGMAGVLPVIFAQSIASLPITVWSFIGIPQEGTVSRSIYNAIDARSFVYIVVYFIMIIGFAYFYSSIQFNPVEIANNMKKQGGFIPGFRPGKPTVDFIKRVLNKITLFGAIYLAIVAICPILVSKVIGNSSVAIGGTSVIIVVGVALETVKALESQMLMRQYKGFLE